MKPVQNLLLKECALQETCAYLDGRRQTTHYRVVTNASAEFCGQMVRRGWRRFGEMFFRPVCAGCTACESLKIDASAYTFSRSEKRVIRKNRHIRTLIRRPSLTRAHLDLFVRYHRYMHERRGWEEQQVTPQNYFTSFVQGHGDFGYEVLYLDGDRLVGVDLIDVLSDGISSIYFYYDPDYAKLSPGKYSLLRQIAMAKARGLRWIYLGYYVEGCQSLEYKRDYTPLWQLEGRPADEDEAAWFPLDKRT